MVNAAQNNFSLLKKKFVSETENLAFLNRCFKDLNYDIEKCFFITIPFENQETFLFIEGNLLGRICFKSKRQNKYYKSKLQKIKYEGIELFKNDYLK